MLRTFGDSKHKRVCSFRHRSILHCSKCFQASVAFYSHIQVLSAVFSESTFIQQNKVIWRSSWNTSFTLSVSTKRLTNSNPSCRCSTLQKPSSRGEATPKHLLAVSSRHLIRVGHRR